MLFGRVTHNIYETHIWTNVTTTKIQQQQQHQHQHRPHSYSYSKEWNEREKTVTKNNNNIPNNVVVHRMCVRVCVYMLINICLVLYPMFEVGCKAPHVYVYVCMCRCYCMYAYKFYASCMLCCLWIQLSYKYVRFNWYSINKSPQQCVYDHIYLYIHMTHTTLMYPRIYVYVCTRTLVCVHL